MSGPTFNNWRSVQDEVLSRIHKRVWKPGDLIPNEVELAAEFGCARATVNRALQNLADSGLLERRRRAGTRVATHPVRKATLDIPVLRNEITGRGFAYDYRLLKQRTAVPPSETLTRMRLKCGSKLLHFLCLHMADDMPYVLESRWIDQQVVPAAAEADFSTQSPNEWLVENIPFSAGDITFSAVSAGSEDAELLRCERGAGLFAIDRSTWKAERAITSVRLLFAPGYKMHTDI